MTSIVHSRILRSKDFGSPSQRHTIRTMLSEMFSLCQTFGQLSRASCCCNSNGLTSELFHFLTNPFPAGPTAFCGAANPVLCLPLIFALPSASSVFSRSHVCFFSFKAHPYNTSSEGFSLRESGSTPLFPPQSTFPVLFLT